MPEMKGRLLSGQKEKTQILSAAPNRENLAWMKYKLDELEMLDCTFKPKTNDKTRVFSPPRVYDQPNEKGGDRLQIDIDFEQQED